VGTRLDHGDVHACRLGPHPRKHVVPGHLWQKRRRCVRAARILVPLLLWWVRRGDDANWNDSALRHSVRRPDTNPRRQRRDRGRARRVFRALSQVTCPHGRLVVPGQNPGVALPRRLVSLPILRGQQITGSSHRQRRQRCRVLRPRRRFRLRYVAARVLVAIGPRTLNHGVAVQRG